MADTAGGYVLDTLRMTAALLLWAVHLAVVYGVVAVACARGHSATATMIIVGAVTLAALLAAAAVLVAALRQLGRGGGSRRFSSALTAMVAGFGLVAIAWDGLPVLLVPACPG